MPLLCWVLMNIFPNSAQFPAPLYPLLTLLVSMALYLALFVFNLQKIVEKVFSLFSSVPHTEATLVYLLLINTPVILMCCVSLVVHHSLVGLQVSCDVDQVQILLVSSYICYVEESRQTPIRGFLFLRDLVVMMCMIGCFIGLCYDGQPRIQYGVSGLTLYLLYYASMHFEESLEDAVLRFLGIRQANVYNAEFLLTQPRKQANYLQLKNTIDQNKQEITKQIEQHRDMLDKLYTSQDQKQILLNFGKLFLPYKIAIQIQQNLELEQNIVKIGEDWVEGEDKDEQWEKQSNEDEADGENKPNQSATCLMYNRTMTGDYVLEEQEQVAEQSKLDKILKCVFYPLYFISTVEGRVRYFLDYLCLFLLCGLIWLVSCSCSYFTDLTSHKSYEIISMLLAMCFTLPSSKYNLRISDIKDFDFINIFMQSSIVKSAILGLLITVIYIVDPAFRFKGSLGLLISSVLNLITYFIFGGFMVGRKFATLRTNVRFLGALSVCSFLLRILAEILFNTLW